MRRQTALGELLQRHFLVALLDQVGAGDAGTDPVTPEVANFAMVIPYALHGYPAGGTAQVAACPTCDGPLFTTNWRLINLSYPSGHIWGDDRLSLHDRGNLGRFSATRIDHAKEHQQAAVSQTRDSYGPAPGR